ncbi:MAG: hypothetical protein M3680_09435 [Myxococcota bacterium]|nr:hypothetical protein [Myxococcota bacterium]
MLLELLTRHRPAAQQPDGDGARKPDDVADVTPPLDHVAAVDEQAADHHVEVAPPQLGVRVVRVVGADHLEAVITEEPGQDISRVLVVVDQEHPEHRREGTRNREHYSSMPTLTRTANRCIASPLRDSSGSVVGSRSAPLAIARPARVSTTKRPFR